MVEILPKSGILGRFLSLILLRHSTPPKQKEETLFYKKIIIKGMVLVVK